MITLTIVADTPEEIQRDVRRLFPGGVPAAVPEAPVPVKAPAPAPEGVIPMKTIIEKAKGHTAPKTAETAPESDEKEAPKEIPS